MNHFFQLLAGRRTVAPVVSFRRFTIMELIVVLSIVGVLTATVSQSMVKAKKGLEAKSGNLLLSSADMSLEDVEDAVSEKKSQRKNKKSKAARRRNAKKTASTRSSDGSDAVPEATTSSSNNMSRARSRRPADTDGSSAAPRSGGDEADDADADAETDADEDASEDEDGEESGDDQKGESQEKELPEPAPFEPKSDNITTVKDDDHEIEPYARFLFARGSEAATIRRYNSLWKKDLKWINQGWTQRRRQGIEMTRYLYYIRRESVYKSSPYRCYVLRRRYLQSLVKPFDEANTRKALEKRSVQEYDLLQKGNKCSFEWRGKKVSGIFEGMEDGLVIVNQKTYRLKGILPAFRWQFDRKSLEAKRRKFIRQELDKAQTGYEQKNRKLINEILDKEFPALRGDPWLAKLR